MFRLIESPGPPGGVTVIRSETRRLPGLLNNLLRDTSPAILIALAESYGLPRVPGLDQPALIARLARHLSAEQLDTLQDALIAARFGGQTVDELIAVALERDAQRSARQGAARQARLDQINPGEAMLLEAGPRRWAYTMHGYDVLIDLGQRRIRCDCAFFSFAAHRHALCKHSATAFRLIPPVYAREALIDLLLWREYGAMDTPPWHFISPQAA